MDRPWWLAQELQLRAGTLEKKKLAAFARETLLCVSRKFGFPD
jgi:hypothetical protein